MIRRYTHQYFFSSGPTTTEIYTLSLHDALPILLLLFVAACSKPPTAADVCSKLVAAGVGSNCKPGNPRSEEHTSELQSHVNLVCRLLLEKKNNNKLTVLDTSMGRMTTVFMASIF